MSDDDTTVPCGLCGEPTRMLGTRRCDRCWELEHRVKADPALTIKVLRAVQLPSPGPPGGYEEFFRKLFAPSGDHKRDDIRSTLVAELSRMVQIAEQNTSLLAGAKLLLEQYDASGDFTMGGKLTNQPFLMLRDAVKMGNPA